MSRGMMVILIAIALVGGGIAWVLWPDADAYQSPGPKVVERVEPHAHELPNIILITLDTLRADHLSVYGYERPTSRNLEAFAETATIYPRSFSTAPWTLPTHVSLFTGRHPYEHGVHSYPHKPMVAQPQLSLDSVTLAEVLKQIGYRTIAITSNTGYLREVFQLNQGFDYYYNGSMAGRGVVESFFAEIDPKPARPFFAFLNFMETHVPYAVYPDEKFLEGPTDDAQAVFRLCRQRSYVGKKIPEEELERLTTLYDFAIYHLDRFLGLLFSELRKRGEFDNTLIIVTGDHGEYLGDHGLIEHGLDLYQGTVFVPLIVKSPNQSAARVDRTPYSSVDIPQLIFSELPENKVERFTDLFPYKPGNHTIVGEVHYAGVMLYQGMFWRRRNDRVRTMMVDWPYKFIHSSDGEHELYNLEDDPGELSNRYESETERIEKFKPVLESIEAARASEDHKVFQWKGPLAEEDVQALRDLGYL